MVNTVYARISLDNNVKAKEEKLRRQIERSKLAREKQLREEAEHEKRALEKRISAYQEEAR